MQKKGYYVQEERKMMSRNIHIWTRYWKILVVILEDCTCCSQWQLLHEVVNHPLFVGAWAYKTHETYPSPWPQGVNENWSIYTKLSSTIQPQTCQHESLSLFNSSRSFLSRNLISKCDIYTLLEHRKTHVQRLIKEIKKWMGGKTIWVFHIN